MATRLKDILPQLEARYPGAWALPGDRVGLLVGHAEALVELILVALEVSLPVVAEARRRGAQLLLTHHPLLYHPLTELREDRPEGRLLAELIRGEVALVSCHTNLDVAPLGPNNYLARALGLAEAEVLAATSRERLCKLVVFVPVGYEEKVRQTLGDLGLGVIGRYSHCSFASRGQGTYRALAGARPFRGEVAQLSRAAEVRLEVLASESRLAAAVDGLKEVHPYEEVAYDLYPLNNPGAPRGLGRIGRWAAPKPFVQVITRIKEIFRIKTVRVWGDPPPEVASLAVLSGSGGEFIGEAQRRGAQVYLTGEVRHHQVPPDLEGFAVLEVGHFASEAVFMEPWAEELQGLFQEANLEVRVEVAATKIEPITYW